MLKSKMNGQDRSDYVRSMMKTRQNDVVDHTSVTYAKNEIELSWLIGLGMIYAKTKTELSRPIWPDVVNEENQTEQQHDKLYRCDLQ